MKRVLLIEPDRLFAQSAKLVLEKENISVDVASTTETAMTAADKHTPDVVISELSLRGHSGSEFLYEFKSYVDWCDVPLIIYSSLQVPDHVKASKDFELLKVEACLYKPHDSLQELVSIVKDTLGSS